MTKSKHYLFCFHFNNFGSRELYSHSDFYETLNRKSKGKEEILNFGSCYL